MSFISSFFLLFGVLLATLVCAKAAIPPPPTAIAIVYNSEIEESRELAEYYAEQRNIPAENLVGLPLPEKPTISRAEYQKLLRDPLAEEFTKRAWWRRRPAANGGMELAQTKIRIIVNMRGVPLRIKHPDPPLPELAEGEKRDPKVELEAIMKSGNAAVDSELAMLGMGNYPVQSALKNPYFNRNEGIMTAKIPMFLVGRLDGPSGAIVKRMINDAVETEKTGLWGFAVIDVANKSAPGDPHGDPWLKAIAVETRNLGFPTFVDRFNQTLPTNFPLPSQTALYYGWYDWHVSGPFKAPGFRLKKGAIAVHLHSFSAAQINNTGQNWSGPLLARGAAVTLGNTFEPFLHLTHNFKTFHDRLVSGFTLVEAAYMAHPALSWQGVVLGDPLYRPFLHLSGSGRKTKEDQEFRAIRLAKMRWSNDFASFEKNLQEAARRMNSGVFLEALGLEQAERGESARAAQSFETVKQLYQEPKDKLRMELLHAKIDREQNRKQAAIEILRKQELLYPLLPEVEAAKEWLMILDPPPPPPEGSN